jgi:hypothetical protein
MLQGILLRCKMSKNALPKWDEKDHFTEYGRNDANLSRIYDRHIINKSILLLKRKVPHYKSRKKYSIRKMAMLLLWNINKQTVNICFKSEQDRRGKSINCRAVQCRDINWSVTYENQLHVKIWYNKTYRFLEKFEPCGWSVKITVSIVPSFVSAKIPHYVNRPI